MHRSGIQGNSRVSARHDLPEGLMTEEETAKYLNLSVKRLRNLRSQNEGPDHFKRGDETFYAKEDCHAWRPLVRIKTRRY